MLSVRLPLARSLLTRAGALSGLPLRAVTGLLTTWLPSVQLSLPYCQTLSGAPLRLSETVKDLVWPGASVRLLGVTMAL